MSADVVVVGGGVIGLAAAERLTATGRLVVLVDAVGMSGGATGVSGGLVRALDVALADPSLATESLSAYLRRGWHGRWPRVRGQGSLVLFGPDDVGRATGGRACLLAAGLPAELLDASDIRRRWPDLVVPADFVGVYEEQGGWLPAREVVSAMAGDAGARLSILTGVRASRVVTSGSRVSGVDTDVGFVSAPAVVLAAGAASMELAATVDVLLPLRNRSVGYCVFRLRSDPGDLPTVVDTTTGMWLRRWDRGSAVLAGVSSKRCHVPSTVDRWVAVAEQRRVREVAGRRYPQVAEATCVGGVTAYDAMAPGDGAVAVWPDLVGLVTATGWNGGGFKIAPAVGARVAAQVRELIA